MDQTDLAAANGIGAFVYYYYWFSEEGTLNRPIKKFRASDPNSPLHVMWTNENRVRRWDGCSQDIPIG